MAYQLQFLPYQRQFARSVTTSHGTWETREGIILKLADETGTIGWGEIAPIPWFGSESLEQAEEFCRQLPTEITEEIIFSIPARLPACQFGFESALSAVLDRGGQASRLPEKDADLQSKICNLKSKILYSGLLPAGETVLQQWEKLWNQGYRTFKWKIGVAAIEKELKLFQRLIQALPESATLRLDANGGLNWQEATAWLQECEACSKIEFIEQPMSVDQFSAMLDLSNRYGTAIALDESVATIDQMQACYQLGWRGIFIIKPCIAGSPSRLRQFCTKCDIDAVFSSVFETAIGRQAALKLAAELSHPQRAVGFGVNHWFAEEEESWLLQLWQKF